MEQKEVKKILKISVSILKLLVVNLPTENAIHKITAEVVVNWGLNLQNRLLKNFVANLYI